MNGYDFAHVLKLFKIHEKLTLDRLRLERKEKATARLQRPRQKDQGWRRSEQIKVRQARLDWRRVHRAAEQPVARRTRLATDRQCTHECRAAEQPEAGQARLRLARKTLWAHRKVEGSRVCSMEHFLSLACHDRFHHIANAAVCLSPFLSPHLHYQMNYCLSNWMTYMHIVCLLFAHAILKFYTCTL